MNIEANEYYKKTAADRIERAAIILGLTIEQLSDSWPSVYADVFNLVKTQSEPETNLQRNLSSKGE